MGFDETKTMICLRTDVHGPDSRIVIAEADSAVAIVDASLTTRDGRFNVLEHDHVDTRDSDVYIHLSLIHISEPTRPY